MDAGFVPIGQRLPWLPDETLFSWCSRYHLMTANGLAGATAMQLFGRRRHCVAHDFPSNLAVLAERTSGSLGSCDSLIEERTLLPFYAAFRSDQLYGHATLSLKGSGIGHLKYQLGLLTGGLGAAHPLKACPHCMHEDRVRHSVAHWRRSHQLPGVWACPTHGIPLLASSLKLDQRARYQFSLPDHAGLTHWSVLPGRRVLDSSLAVLHRLARLSIDLCGVEPGRLADPHAVAAAFLRGIALRGWTTATGRVTWKTFQAELGRHAEVMALLPPMAMQMDGQVGRVQLARILSARGLAHPLRYLVWMTLLFESLKDFISAYDAVPALESLATTGGTRTLPREDSRAREVALRFQSGQETATSLAKQYGVDPSTVAAWLARSGIATPRRAKVMDEGKSRLAAVLLRNGCDKEIVAARLGVAEVTITRELRRVPGLQACWHEARRECARQGARAAWTQVAAAASILGVAAARRAEPAAYAWLYRNDRQWLQKQCEAELSPCKAGAYSRVRRERADVRYAASLQTALAALAAETGLDLFDPGRWAILAPGLKRVLRRPRDWPRTIAVLQMALRARGSDAIGLICGDRRC